MALDLASEKWLDKLVYPAGKLRSEISKRKSFYDNPNRNQYHAPYVYDLIKYLHTPFTEWEAYEKGIINDKGKKLRNPKSDENKYWNYFIAQIAYLKNQLSNILTTDRTKKIVGRMAMLRESKENRFKLLVELLEDTNSERIFNSLQEVVSAGDAAGTDTKLFKEEIENPKMTFRKFVDMKFHSKCSECKYFIQNDCIIKDKVIDKYGSEEYNTWITHPELRNACYFYGKKVIKGL
jgi:hypothetical protein